MAGFPPPYPPPGPPSGNDWKYQRRILKDQARAQRDQIRFQRRAMRRHSILGPLVITAIGVVFLLVQTGHLSSDYLWDWYGRWWPFLLVVAGLVLLAEWGFDQYRSNDSAHPYARRSVGGLFPLLGLVLFSGFLVSAAHRHGDNFTHGFNFNPDDLNHLFGDKHESDQSLTATLPTGGALSIDNPHGDVTITGTSDDDLIHIAVHKQVFSHSDADAEQKAQQFSPKVKTSGNLVAIALPSMDGAEADLTLTVPAAAVTTVNANHGDVRADQLKAAVTITSNHGDVAVSSITGPVVTRINNNGSSFSAHSITGPVSLEGHAGDLTLSDITGAVTIKGEIFGSTHFEHISGPVKLHTSRTDFQVARLAGEVDSEDSNFNADQAVGPLVLSTGNRNVTLERISGDISVTNRNGSVDITSAPPTGNVTVQNRNGAVTLTLPNKSGFNIHAETTDGDIDNDFSLPSTSSSNNRNTLSGSINGGGPLIRIDTTKEDISIKKASVAPLAPPAPPKPPSPPALSVKGDDGSSVYVGKDGVRIISGSDGSSVIIGRDGLNIKANADGSSIYHSKDGTTLIEGADGSKTLTHRNGMHYTEGADGSKTYRGNDGTRIVLSASGSQNATGPGGNSLTDSEIKSRLQQAEQELRQAEHQRDEERNQHRHNHDD